MYFEAASRLHRVRRPEKGVWTHSAMIGSDSHAIPLQQSASGCGLQKSARPGTLPTLLHLSCPRFCRSWHASGKQQVTGTAQAADARGANRRQVPAGMRQSSIDRKVPWPLVFINVRQRIRQGLAGTTALSAAASASASASASWAAPEIHRVITFMRHLKGPVRPLASANTPLAEHPLAQGLLGLDFVKTHWFWIGGCLVTVPLSALAIFSKPLASQNNISQIRHPARSRV